MFVLHETCLEYFRRRLSEGWKCVSLEGHNAVLLPPDGNVRRELDLRNDVETLRPNAPGDEESITHATSGAGNHWQDVNEAIPDEEATRVVTRWPHAGYKRDLYNLPASSGRGTINFIKVYFRCFGFVDIGPAKAKASIKSNATVTDGDEEIISTVEWTTYSMQWNTNPADDAAWEWADIDALQIGVSLSAFMETSSRCTQVYVEVDYTTEVLSAPNAATGITSTSAILNGAIADDLGDAYYVGFQWGRTEDYGNDTPWQPALPAVASFETGDTFSQLITGLVPGTLYHFRAQAKDGIGTVYGDDVAFWTLKPSVGKGYAFSREYHIKRATDALDVASIAAEAITALADCKGINLVEVPSSLTLTVEATYGAATQGIKVHVRTSLTDRATGTHTGADDAAALTDDEAHFVADELIGLTIKNLTDGSSGAITGNTATGVTATLVGGTDNDWDASDAYIIEGAGYDTEDFDSFTPAFAANSSIRQTKVYEVDPVYVKVLVENLDPAEAVTDVKISLAVGG